MERIEPNERDHDEEPAHDAHRRPHFEDGWGDTEDLRSSWDLSPWGRTLVIGVDECES